MEQSLEELVVCMNKEFANLSKKTLYGFDSYYDRFKYLHSVLRRRNEISVHPYVMAIGNLVGRTLKFDVDDEVSYYIIDDCELKMVTVKKFIVHVRDALLDGCFIVELFRKYTMKELRDPDDSIFNTRQRLHDQRRDFISINRQVPFIFLVEIFNMTRIEGDPRDNLIDLALHFFENMVSQALKPPPSGQIPIDKIENVLGLLHASLCLPPLASSSETRINLVVTTTEEEVELQYEEVELQYIICATELQEAGVKFKKREGTNWDIIFKNGVLEIPPLKVAGITPHLLRNLMKYEKEFPDYAMRIVNDYVKFILCLINSPKDVALLCRSGVIENLWGKDREILEELNELGSEAQISRNFTYSQIFKQVNKHCGRRRNVWMAKLWKRYFSSPGSLISFFAAVVLLLFTLTQTVFTILSYHP